MPKKNQEGYFQLKWTSCNIIWTVVIVLAMSPVVLMFPTGAPDENYQGKNRCPKMDPGDTSID